eukprot:9125042-Pyramimonas_sp.AAC.1
MGPGVEIELENPRGAPATVGRFKFFGAHRVRRHPPGAHAFREGHGLGAGRLPPRAHSAVAARSCAEIRR